MGAREGRKGNAEMLADHMPMDLIMKYSELSEERILELKKDLNVINDKM